MEGELCKGEVTASFILTLAQEETWCPVLGNTGECAKL